MLGVGFRASEVYYHHWRLHSGSRCQSPASFELQGFERLADKAKLYL